MKRLPGKRNWSDSATTLVDDTVMQAALHQQFPVDTRPVTTLCVRMRIDSQQETQLWEYLEFLELVYEVSPEIRWFRDGWIGVTLHNTPLKSVVGIHVATWLYHMPEARLL